MELHITVFCDSFVYTYRDGTEARIQLSVPPSKHVPDALIDFGDTLTRLSSMHSKLRTCLDLNLPMHLM